MKFPRLTDKQITYFYLKNKKKAREKAISTPSLKYRNIEKKSNIQFNLEGVYFSYWLRKFFNTFIKSGKKKKIYKKLYLCLLIIKFEKNIFPTLYIFEIIDNLRPSFSIENFFPRKKRIMVQYPRLSKPTRLYAVALKWIRNLIQIDYINKTRLEKITFISALNNALEYLDPKNKVNKLFKRRTLYYKVGMRLERHMHYGKKRIKL